MAREATGHWSDALRPLRPCERAMAWLRTQPSPEAAWEACEEPEWMIWALGRAGAKAACLASSDWRPYAALIDATQREHLDPAGQCAWMRATYACPLGLL